MEEKKLNLYKMTYAEIQQFDCGLRYNEKFPDQKKINAVKPTLKMVVRAVEKLVKEKSYPLPYFNIEIKSQEKDYNLFQPEPAIFVSLVVNEIRRLGIEDRIILQSFDLNVLECLHADSNRHFAIAYLAASGKSLKAHLKYISFTPDIFSPHFSLVSEIMVRECHESGIRIIPWTVNDPDIMRQMKAWGCDGAITDLLFTTD
jgi:glycerophosphoryl diester phosphodiesterase